MTGRMLLKDILWLAAIGAMGIDEAEELVCAHMLPLFDTIHDQDDQITALEEELEQYHKGA